MEDERSDAWSDDRSVITPRQESSSPRGKVIVTSHCPCVSVSPMSKRHGAEVDACSHGPEYLGPNVWGTRRKEQWPGVESREIRSAPKLVRATSGEPGRGATEQQQHQ